MRLAGDGNDSIDPWLRRALEGDLACFGELVRAHQSDVRRQLRQLTRGDAALADDLAQETFLDAWKGLPGFRADARFSTWLHRIAYRRFLMYKRANRMKFAEASGPEDTQDPTADIAAPCNETLRLDISRALALLPEHERVAVVHCYFLDLSHEEAAQVLDLPLGTVKSQIARARARLKDALAAWRARD